MIYQQYTSTGSEVIPLGSGHNINPTMWTVQLEPQTLWTGSITITKTVGGASGSIASAYKTFQETTTSASIVTTNATGLYVDGSQCTVFVSHSLAHANTGSLLITWGQTFGTNAI